MLLIILSKTFYFFPHLWFIAAINNNITTDAENIIAGKFKSESSSKLDWSKTGLQGVIIATNSMHAIIAVQIWKKFNILLLHLS